MKVTRNVSYPEARKLVTSAAVSNGQSYAAAASCTLGVEVAARPPSKTNQRSVGTQTDVTHCTCSANVAIDTSQTSATQTDTPVNSKQATNNEEQNTNTKQNAQNRDQGGNLPGDRGWGNSGPGPSSSQIRARTTSTSSVQGAVLGGHRGWKKKDAPFKKIDYPRDG